MWIFKDSTRHSVKFTRKEIYNPFLIDRNRRGLWIKNGRRDMFERAHEKIEEILNEPIESKLTKVIESELKEYYKIISDRTLEDYKKNEGMGDSEVKINVLGI